MKSYWIIYVLLFTFIYALRGQDIPIITINEDNVLKKDSIQTKIIEAKKNHWQRKIEQLKSLGRKPKIGLVLSGGGAKGFAHIAILQMLEKYDISLDYIGGTSAGALVGGLYAVGYTAHQIDSIFRVVDFSNFFKDEYSRIEKPFMDRINNNDKYLLSLPFSSKGIDFPISYSKGQKLADELTHLINYRAATIHVFSKFPVPFFCIATNLTTGREKIFDNGYLVEALLASMALPSLFSPVRIRDTLFIDGGIVNNLPTEEMKQRGMDIVIAVDISDRIEKPTLNSIVTYVDYLFSMMIKNNVDNQTKFADILIKPDIKNFSSTSFDDKDSIYQKGINAANLYEKQFNDIADLCNEYNNEKIKIATNNLPNN
ncbi:MAG: patatin-like phospholipase family protein, partial [Anaerovoracaceae bacterium]